MRSVINKRACCLFAALCTTFAATAQAPPFRPVKGFVPNQATAIAVAEAVLSPVYGEEQIHSERPFHAELHGDTWTVNGSIPPEMKGGVATVRLSRTDGRILYMMHGK